MFLLTVGTIFHFDMLTNLILIIFYLNFCTSCNKLMYSEFIVNLL